ncbi:protein trichome birefringence-like 19 [Senna tora]|uniref:Protein trichome birefringence-like 19 n=1 Tax=Senna tora TaxID=362788 RepID=A0A834STF1_9FABA|nr:protein trichome birefringence-like 19 [Senna tora]
MGSKFDREYLHWRLRPDDCELPLFDDSVLQACEGEINGFWG